MGLDYGYTCGDIDSAISSFEDTTKDHLSDIYEELCPDSEDESLKEIFIKDWGMRISEDFSQMAESVRSINSDMRKEADTQIDDLDSKNDDLEDKVNYMQSDISNFNSEIEDLKDIVYDLENK